VYRPLGWYWVEDAGGICLDGRALVAGGIGGSPGGRLVLCVIGVSSMFGGIIVLGTTTVSGATGMPVAPGNGG